MNDDRIDSLIESLNSEVHGSDNYFNFNPDHDRMLFDSEMGYDSDMYDFEPGDTVLGYENTGIKGAGLSTYSINLTYTPVAGVPAPVTVEIWGTDLNTGTVTGDTLVFTNAGGDFVTISGRTSPFIPFQNSLRYEPFNIRFARMIPQAASQFFQNVTFRHDSKWGSFKGNDQLPDTYFNPEQFQSLRVDIPMGFAVGPRDRMIFDVDPTEVSPGMNMIFFIDKALDPKRMVQKRNPLVNMSGPGLIPQMPAQTDTVTLNKLIHSQKNMLAMMRGNRRPGAKAGLGMRMR